jgi:hypothetical protein
MSVTGLFRKSLHPTPPGLPKPTQLLLRRHHGLHTCIPGLEGKLDWSVHVNREETNGRLFWTPNEVFIQSSMALQPSVGLWPNFSVSYSYTHNRSDSSDRGSARRKAATSTQNSTNRIKAHRHPCLEMDSNPRHQCSSGRRQFVPQMARPMWSAAMKLWVA